MSFQIIRANHDKIRPLHQLLRTLDCDFNKAWKELRIEASRHFALQPHTCNSLKQDITWVDAEGHMPTFTAFDQGVVLFIYTLRKAPQCMT